MKKLLCLIVVMLILTSCIHVTEQHSDFDKYGDDLTEVQMADKFMPSLDSLGDYEDVRYEYKAFSDYLFTQETIALVVKYSDEKYEEMKASLDDSYDFIDSPVTKQYEDEDKIYYLIPVTEVKRDGFSYRIAGETCKWFVMVGYNDEVKEIAFWFFSSFDLDFIAEEGDDLTEEMDWFLDHFYYIP